jgi:hypothetical protein
MRKVSACMESFVACASLDCTKFIIVMVDICPWWSEVLWATFDFLVSICNFPRYSIACTHKGFGLLVGVRIHLVWLDLRNMVVLGDLHGLLMNLMNVIVVFRFLMSASVDTPASHIERSQCGRLQTLPVLILFLSCGLVRGFLTLL